MAGIVCTRCKTEKPVERFYKNARMKSGRLRQCIDCVQERRSIFRSENREDIRAKDRARYLRDREKLIAKAVDYYKRNREVNSAAVARYRTTKPEAHYAHRRVSDAIKLGKLAVQPCERCGYGLGVQAHHEDYSKPLDVTWLCKRCHGARHREINEQLRKAG